MSYTPRTSLEYNTAPECYTSSKYLFVGSAYDMWKLNGNCTHYAYARSCELAGKDIRKDMMDTFGDAGTWLSSAKWETGTEARLGAVAVFDNHVAVVEAIYKDGRIKLSQSSYKTFIFNTVIRKLSVGDKLDNVAGKLKGYIYNPYVAETDKADETPSTDTGTAADATVVSKDTPITTEQAIQRMAEDVIAGRYGNGAYNRMSKIYKVVQTRVNEILGG